ncbi:hypothetical protein BS50DRAFT_412119 [Corynespora cassiicola Philippines]|uniref:Uncharacterized protein n=1 Tax=Corynespora cassiicola Philippines TaxID=1448308 RepID=A0A2T2NMN0_CORCC|nr:hypothetical protein BS50DRAFT_412119 [Corynespora cassiicola Philippines]
MSRVGQTFAGHSDAAQLRFLAGCAGHAGRAGRALPPFRRVAGGCVASCGCLEERPQRPQRPQHPPRAHRPKGSPTSAPCSPNSFRLVVVRRRPLQDTPARGISPMEIGRVDCLHYIRHLHDLCRAAPPAGLNRQHAGSMRHRAASSAIVCHRRPSLHLPHGHASRVFHAVAVGTAAAAGPESPSLVAGSHDYAHTRPRSAQPRCSPARPASL